MLTDDCFRKVDHLFDVRYFANAVVIRIAIKKIGGERNLAPNAAPQQVAYRTLQRLSLNIEDGKFKSGKPKDETKKLFGTRRRHLPAKSFEVHGVFTDQQRLQLRELTGAAGAAIAFAKAGDAFVGFDLDYDARKSRMGSNRITQGRFDRDESRSPANVRNLHCVSGIASPVG